MALADQVIYNLTKGAVKTITRTAAVDLADRDIRVNGLSPGRMVTPLAEESRKVEERSEGDDLVKPVPIGRPATPDEITPRALFLASDGASYVTGELLTIDGAWSIY